MPTDVPGARGPGGPETARRDGPKVGGPSRGVLCLDTSLTATVSALVELVKGRENWRKKKKEREKEKEGRKENRRK